MRSGWMMTKWPRSRGSVVLTVIVDAISSPNTQAVASQPLTEADEANIIYLMGIGGYSRARVIEAYIASGKNTEHAANLLLDGL